MRAPYEITPVRTDADVAAAAILFRAYAASLTVDLAYQGFEAELAALPGKYAPPGGELLLARSGDGAALGCAALRPTGVARIAEIKRLYVAPAARGTGLGRSLAEAIIASAANLGYGEVRLDTLPTMADAIRLYRKLGFETIEPNYDTPVAGTVFLRKQL